MKLCKAWPETPGCDKSTKVEKSDDGLDENRLVEGIVEPKAVSVKRKVSSARPTKVSKELKKDLPKELPKELPKSVVDRAVNRVVSTAMSDLLKDAFGSEELEDPEGPEAGGPQDVDGLHIDKRVAHVNSSGDRVPKADFTLVWAIMVAFGILVFVSLQNMWARIDSMEAWLHGRLASGP